MSVRVGLRPMARTLGAPAPPPVIGVCGFNYFTNSIDVTPTEYGVWVDIDVSEHVPETATGVIVEVLTTSGLSNRLAYIREKGSTDAGYGWGKSHIQPYGHVFYIVGVDEDFFFQAAIRSATEHVYLVGYTDGYVTMFTNRIDVSTSTLGSWQDTDVSAHVPEGATGVILQIVNCYPDSRDPYHYYLRPPALITESEPGSDINEYETHMTVCGVDGDRHFEQWLEHAGEYVYLCGYFKAPMAFLTTEEYLTVIVDNTWREADVSAHVPEGACGVMLYLRAWTTGRRLAVRRKGSTDDRSAYSRLIPYARIGAFVGVDEDRIFEYKAEGVTCAIILLGYSMEA